MIRCVTFITDILKDQWVYILKKLQAEVPTKKKPRTNPKPIQVDELVLTRPEGLISECALETLLDQT